MADSLRDSGLNLIREYLPDSPVYTPEDEPSQYNIPYVPSSPVYPTPVYNPPTPEYTPSFITTVPELNLVDMKKEKNIHIKFLDPSASPTPNGMPSESPQQQNVHIKFLDQPASPPSNYVITGTSHLQTTPMQYTSPAADTLHPESSGPPDGMPMPVHISRGIPPEMKSDTDLDAGQQQAGQPDQPIEIDKKEEGECTEQDDQYMPPLEDASMEEDKPNTFPPDPWNDSASTLQDRLNQVRWESLEPEPNFEIYGYDRYDEERKDILIEMERMHRCVDQMTLQNICESQENFKDFMIQKATIKLQVYQIKGIMQSIDSVSESQHSIKKILQDLYDIINEMNNPNRGDSSHFKLQKINDISNRMTQVNLGQESVKEVMTELKNTLERKPENNKRGYYQTIDCDHPH